MTDALTTATLSLLAAAGVTLDAIHPLALFDLGFTTLPVTGRGAFIVHRSELAGAARGEALTGPVFRVVAGAARRLPPGCATVRGLPARAADSFARETLATRRMCGGFGTGAV